MENDKLTTVEKQYQAHLDLRDKYGLVPLGVEKSGSWRTDPRRLLFVLARYKFVGKMWAGKERVLEVGCGDAWPVPMVLQEVRSVHATDIDPIFIEDAIARQEELWPFTCQVHDMLAGPLGAEFDAAYSLDVIEHIPAADEDRFLINITQSLREHGVLIIGCPSLESQRYASPISKAGHINCKDAPTLKTLLSKYFSNVFMFSMNDEVVHTGYSPMAQYLFAICTDRKPL
jgi:2-polyprenyl-3-methyl-5-hydroxy-6-metoxy-1,4-benzoquinol methylase